MKKTILMILVVLLSATWLFAQTDERISRHSVSYHLGGTASLFMLEYQFSPIVKENFRASLTAGLGHSGFVLEFPAGVEVNIGHKNQLLAGAQFVPTMIYDLDDEFDGDVVWRYALSPRLGYKRLFQGKYNLFFLEAYASPLVYLDNGQFLPWFGLAFGGYF